RGNAPPSTGSRSPAVVGAAAPAPRSPASSCSAASPAHRRWPTSGSTTTGVPSRRRGSGVTSSGSASADLLHDLVGDVEVGVDVLHVVAVLERLDHPEDLPGLRLVDRHGDARDEARLRRLVVEAGLL